MALLSAFNLKIIYYIIINGSKNIEKIKLLEQENELLKQKLSNYTNSPAYKKYYEANKDKIKNRFSM